MLLHTATHCGATNENGTFDVKSTYGTYRLKLFAICFESDVIVSHRSHYSSNQGHAGQLCVFTRIVHVGVDVKKRYPELTCNVQLLNLLRCKS